MAIQNTQMSNDNARIIDEARDATRGFVAVSACSAGWSPQISVEMGRVAEPAVSARLIDGVPAQQAIQQAIAEVETMAAVEVFARAMANGASPQAAFDAVVDIRRRTMPDARAFEQVVGAARNAFEEAMMRGLTPYAALVAANVAASAAQRLLARSVK